MRLIELYVNGVVIESGEQQDIIADSVNDIGCIFHFSYEWEGLSKIAVFTGGSRSISAKVGDEPVALPWETLQNAGVPYKIGVYGYEGDSLVRQTTPVHVGYVQCGTRRAGEGSQFTPTLAQTVLKEVSDISKRVDEMSKTIPEIIWIEL